MPIVAGILEILAGFMFLASVFLYLMMLHVVGAPWVQLSLAVILAGFLGILPLVGGVCALLRRRWRLALAGAIATLPLFLVAQFGGRLLVGDLGTNLTTLSFRLVYLVLPILLSVAIITLVILSKKEFK